MTDPSSPAFKTSCRKGSSRARRRMFTPVFSSPSALTLSSALMALMRVISDERAAGLVRRDAARAAEILERRRIELAAGLFGDDRAAGQCRDVLEHRLAAVAEARGLDPEDVQRTAELVHDERRERLAVD